MVSFLDLPHSVRQRIYRYALVQKRIFVRPFMSMGYLIDADRIEKYGIPNLNLLCASKQIYAEAIPIYLNENTFSIVQVDLLAAASADSERVAYNIKMIRRVELIFDTRDYIYMAQFLVDELPEIAGFIDDYVYNSSYKENVIDTLLQLRDRLDVPGLDPAVPESITSRSSPEGQERHRRHIANMKEFLWGRTLTFVRQTFSLGYLSIDLRHTNCLSGCCRLSFDVLNWGWFRIWLHGLPKEIQIRCYAEHEHKLALRCLNRQHFHHGMKLEDIFDPCQIVHCRELARYKAILEDACFNKEEWDQETVVGD